MPRIDPLSLLKCLSVLLGPTGGIKSREEVHRLANLMTKFSKKLVSKCIYIQILKTTNTDLLSQFMSAGGWNLIHTWLTDGILAKNWALIQELLELLLLCPVDIERLKSNNCPKLIKGLSKEGSHQGVRTLASRLVEQWLKIVKGEAAPNSVPAQIMTVPVQSNATIAQTATTPSSSQQQQRQQLQYSVNTPQILNITETATVHVQDLKFEQQSTQSTVSIPINQQDSEKQQQLQERLQPQVVQIVGKVQQTQVQPQVTQQQCKKQSFVVLQTPTTTPSTASKPVYKITIRDGNQVLTKVETDAANINNALNTTSTSTDSEQVLNIKEVKADSEELDETEENGSATIVRDDVVDVVQSDDSGHVPSEVKQTLVSSKDIENTEGVKSKDIKDSKDIVSSDSSKSSDKENRDSHKKDDKKSSSSSDKKNSSHHHGSSSSSSLSSSSKSSKHSTSSSAHRSSSTSHKSSSHRSGSSSSNSSSSKSSSSSKDRSSKDKDKHHSSSSSKHSSNRSRSERDKERDKEKEKQKKDQAEKDKATLEKVQGVALSSKMGKIPKKRTEDEKSGDTSGRKVSTESRDSSKENKEKADSKKDVIATKQIITEKKNISISIENRKSSQDSGTRPKTVKTFNSKFRSTGLEEEVKPPPPRSKKVAPVVDKKILPPKLPLKRPSPMRDVPLVERRMKVSLDSPTTPPSDEKKGGIKLIPPKPKPMMLQESDMFMDALTASTKSKEPRKRKRRASITKDGPSETKKQEIVNSDNRESTPPPSPSNVEEKSSVALKPNFKFYQDTLEIDEDKDQKERESGEEESKKDKDLMLDEEKDNRDDDDIGSNTPTPEDDVEEMKDVESPEDASSVVSDSIKKDSSYPEIRYVDGLKSVLLLQKRKGPKKVLKWKTDLESIRYFELDETERVNVTKTFTDMKQMEKQNEREAFQMARKLNNEDLMEERTRWKPLIPIDLPPPLVDPGKDSKEKDIQYAREKGILQALYFNRSMIPDSAAEPDEERHHLLTDPKIIPLEDLTGNKESEKDFTAVPWPEPKPQPPQPSTVTTFHYPTTYPHNQQNMMASMGPQSTMGPMPQMPQQMMPPTHMAPMTQEMAGPMPATGGGGWRTGDGKVLVPDVNINPMTNMSGGFNQGMEGAPMVPPGMMGPPPMYNQEGYGMMCPDDMGYNNFQGPPGPMYGPPGPNFPGPRGAHMHNRGRGGPGWGYRGPVRGGWRGVGGGGWRGSGKQPPVCRQFSKNGFCRVGDKCQYLHPGVNCPPF